MGTSFEELRLARGAPAEIREALARRLGIRLDPVQPDQLDNLLPPADLSENWLERMFGLADTHRDLLDPPAPRPELLQWRDWQLRALWMSQDHPAPPGA